MLTKLQKYNIEMIVRVQANSGRVYNTFYKLFIYLGHSIFPALKV